jgi:hypothetical protein
MIDAKPGNNARRTNRHAVRVRDAELRRRSALPVENTGTVGIDRLQDLMARRAQAQPSCRINYGVGDRRRVYVAGIIKKYGKAIVVSPEYLGEQNNHPWTEIDAAGFVKPNKTEHFRLSTERLERVASSNFRMVVRLF